MAAPTANLNQRLEAAMRKIGAAVERGAEAALVPLADASQNAARKYVSGPGKGRVYTWRGARPGEKPDYFVVVKGRVIPVKRRAKPHTASAPYDPPAVDTGALRRSIEAEPVKSKGQVNLFAGGHEAPYALYLELGTQNMLARPFMASSQFAHSRALADAVADAVARELRKLG